MLTRRVLDCEGRGKGNDKIEEGMAGKEREARRTKKEVV